MYDFARYLSSNSFTSCLTSPVEHTWRSGESLESGTGSYLEMFSLLVRETRRAEFKKQCPTSLRP